MLLEATSCLLITKGDILLDKLTPDDELPKTKLLIQRLSINMTFTSSNSSPTASQYALVKLNESSITGQLGGCFQYTERNKGGRRIWHQHYLQCTQSLYAYAFVSRVSCGLLPCQLHNFLLLGLQALLTQ